MPLFGKPAQAQKNKNHIGVLKKLSNVFLHKNYILACDSYHTTYFYSLHQRAECVPGKEFNLDKKIAFEVYDQGTFIEMYPTKNGIWAINNLRQIMLCSNPVS
jgi:hypothetical protein